MDPIAWRSNATFQAPVDPKNLLGKFGATVSQDVRTEDNLLGQRMAEDAVSTDPEKNEDPAAQDKQLALVPHDKTSSVAMMVDKFEEASSEGDPQNTPQNNENKKKFKGDGSVGFVGDTVIDDISAAPLEADRRE